MRVWAFGEGGPNDVKPIADFDDWPRHHSFRFAPNEWNEEAFVHLDKVIAEAAKNNIYVQLCLTNWWRDTGGVTQYLALGRNQRCRRRQLQIRHQQRKAILFYTNPETRRLYREHIEKLATRRNTITGVLYRDDPTIFGWELMNEAQVITGRWAERRAWFAEMSAYLKSLDPNHMITPGAGVIVRRRTARVAGGSCDSDDRLLRRHNYPRDDHDSFVDSPTALKEFIENRAAAAFSFQKAAWCLVSLGWELTVTTALRRSNWYQAFFDGNARAARAGQCFGS